MQMTELVVMAAGMGSRFGGNKQVAAVGPNGEAILDYSLYDAAQAGFGRAVLIITRAMERDFRDTIGRRLEKIMDVAYAFQELDRVPAGYEVPQGRQKPWGTAHALFCAREQVRAPFGVINADDFYGRDSFVKLHDELARGDDYCMVAYRLGNTLTENGTVNRGVCTVENGFLTGVTEHTALDRNSPLSMDAVVSMNMWGLRETVFPELEEHIAAFFQSMEDPLKSEVYLPQVIDALIRAGRRRVRVLQTDERWYGITYREDLEAVRAAVRDMIAQGVYPDGELA